MILEGARFRTAHKWISLFEVPKESVKVMISLLECLNEPLEASASI
jgi:hypothetical protein